MRRTFQLLLFLLLLIGGSSFCFAQSTNAGDIRGTVTDTTGAVVPGVTVTVSNVATGVSKTYVTNQDGIYDTSSIVTGSYTVTFVKDGFETFTRGPITLQVGFTGVNAELKVGSTTTQVVVSTDIPLLQTETGDQSTVLASQALAALPQVGANWENLLALLPGTTGAPNAGQGAANPGESISANGNLPYNNILADGASTTLSHSQNSNLAIMDTVAELQVSLSSFSAQYGIGGLIMNQITKGGTNTFHGTAYDYIQNSYFNSRSRVYSGESEPVSFLRYHTFGGNIGGPILKKKMFFFFDYDQDIRHGAAYNATMTVPTEPIMSGNFNTETRTIYDPFTQTIAHDSKGNPYPVRKSFAEEYGNGNKIPQALIDSVAQSFQSLVYPTAAHHLSSAHFVDGTTNSMGLYQNNWYTSVPQSSPRHRYFGRLDWDITSNNRLSMSDSQNDTPSMYPNGITDCPVGCQSNDGDKNNAQITDVWNISPTLINEARIGYTWEGTWYGDLGLGQGYADKIGWKFAEADTIPNIGFGNTNPYDTVQPQSNSVYKQHVFDPSDVVTMIRGRHILHFGGEMLIYRDDSTPWGNTNAGAFDFSGQYTQHWSVDPATGVAKADGASSGVEYADFLLGLSTHWDAAVSPEYGARLKSPQVFIQDDYKLRPNLTINLGVRYQMNHGWNETHGNEATFDPMVTNPATGSRGAMWYGTTHENGRRSLQANVFNLFMPRFGFSWQPKTDTTVHGAIGLYSYNWSLDNYGSGMGSALSSSGSADDQTQGITPLVKLNSQGTFYGTTTQLPYTAASAAPDRFNGSNASYNPYHTPIPKIVEYNFTIQRQFGSHYLAEVAYIGSHGFSLPFPTDLNAIPDTKLSANDTAYRPYAAYQSITGNTYESLSNYNSLQASITKRMSNGLDFMANYIWSHFMDNQDSAGWNGRQGPQNYQVANNALANYGNSNFDQRQALKTRVLYRLPFGKGAYFLNQNPWVDTLVGGWDVSGTGVFTAGQPIMVYVPTSSFVNTGAAWQRAGMEYPNWNPGVSWKPKHQNNMQWINPAAFTLPTDGTFGNVKRNSLVGPGFASVNLSAGKSFGLPWEGIALHIRADANNAFNHTSLGNPGWIGLTSSQTGFKPGDAFDGPTGPQIRGNSVSGRSVQFTAKVTF